jgi:hypothetical protein
VGDFRNGARTALNLMAKMCKLSRLPGFRLGMSNILGPDVWAEFLVPFDALCAAVDALIAADNWFNQVDYQEETVGSEDIGAPS